MTGESKVLDDSVTWKFPGVFVRTIPSKPWPWKKLCCWCNATERKGGTDVYVDSQERESYDWHEMCYCQYQDITGKYCSKWICDPCQLKTGRKELRCKEHFDVPSDFKDNY